MARARAGAPGDALSDQQPLRISVLGNGLDPILLAGVKDGRFTDTKALAATWRVSEVRIPPLRHPVARFRYLRTNRQNRPHVGGISSGEGDRREKDSAICSRFTLDSLYRESSRCPIEARVGSSESPVADEENADESLGTNVFLAAKTPP